MALNLLATVGLDGSGFEKGLRRLQTTSHEVFKGIAEFALASFGVHAIGESIRKTVEDASRLVDVANRLGVGTEAFQEMNFAAQQTGASMEALIGFIERLNTSRIDPKKRGAFTDLGIGVDSLQKDAISLIMDIHQAVRGRNPQEFVGALRQVGGRGAGEVIPLLRENLEELRETAVKVNAVMSTKTLVELKAMGDEMKVLSTIMRVVLGRAIISVAEVILKVVSTFKAAKGFWDSFLDQNLSTGTGLSRVWDQLKANFFGGEGSIHGKAAIDNLKLAWEEMKKSFTPAGAASEAAGNDFDEWLANLRKTLIGRQTTMEGMEPDFEMGKSKKHDRAVTMGDSAVSYGNFLGGDTTRSVLTEQLEYTRKISEDVRKLRENSERATTNDMDSNFD